MVKIKQSRKRIGVSDPSEEELYLKSAGISAGGINTFINDGPADFHNKGGEDTYATVLGSSIHCLRYTPSDFNDKFSVIEERFDGNMGVYIQTLAEGIVNGLSEETAMENAYIQSAFKWPRSRVVDAFKADGYQKYFKALINSHGRHVLSSEEKTTANQCLISLLSHKTIQEVASRTTGEIWIERPIVWTIDTPTGPILCKSKPDLAHIDFEKKIITVEDTKTTSKPKRQWEELIKERGSFRQTAFYCGAIEKKLWQDGKKSGPYKKQYTWNSLVSMVETTSERHHVEVYAFDDKTLTRAFDECTEAVNKIQWHRQSNLWDYPRDYYEGDGTIKLNIYNI